MAAHHSPSPGGAGVGASRLHRPRTVALTHHAPVSHSSVWHWFGGALPAFLNTIAFIGLGLAVVVTAYNALRWIWARHRAPTDPWWLEHKPWLRPTPTLTVSPFADGAMARPCGAALAALAQARIGGGREAGVHLYLVSGEHAVADSEIAQLTAIPQGQIVALVLLLLRSWGRRRLTVSGTLLPVGDQGAAALSLVLYSDRSAVATGDFWPDEPPTDTLDPADAARVLAVAAAGWIEHHVVDQTPGPRAADVFYSSDARSWALFRAGSELQRMSRPLEAADAYEQALALDEENVGALVDLAHLRRRGGAYRGAEALARRAARLIEARNRGVRSDDEDPDWYRAHIVLATVYAEWARDELGDSIAHQVSAYAQARQVASTALAKVDGLFPPRGAPDPQAPLRELLVTTFIPGAVVLVLGPGQASPPPPPLGPLGPQGPAQAPAIDSGTRALLQGMRAMLDTQTHDSDWRENLLSAIAQLPFINPRVDYNLACFYSQRGQIELAAERLRVGICRTPRLERGSLLAHAKVDPDLRALRRARPALIDQLGEPTAERAPQGAH
ncbi:MAG TPA: hypothetical protein VHX88_14305 [Solirubrobacteraceae bacterium]|jgi:tetratricopeptide (TPR) repeat protein|nr:hypothetical protein [Solirubrobacteraceae bacterium]